MVLFTWSSNSGKTNLSMIEIMPFVEEIDYTAVQGNFRGQGMMEIFYTLIGMVVTQL